MTGIVLCEISSGLSIEPGKLLDGIIGDTVSITFKATNAEGAVTWSTRSKRFPVSTSAYSGLTLTDNGDGTATLSGTYNVASYRGMRSAELDCWDSAGQAAFIAGYPKVMYREPLQIGVPSRAASVWYMFALGGPGPNPSGPQEGAYDWSFAPALPADWSYTASAGGPLTVPGVQITVGSGSYAGTVTVSIQINLEMPEEAISASRDLVLQGT